MKRRTLKALRPKKQPEHHHNVYVVLLDSDVGKNRKVRAANPKRDRKKPCVYVGMTGLSPEERFANHKAGIKSAWAVRRYGLRLLPQLFAQEHVSRSPRRPCCRNKVRIRFLRAPMSGLTQIM